MLLRYAACDDHNMTTTITTIASVSGGRCPPVSGVRWPVAGVAGVSGGRWPVAGWKAAEKVRLRGGSTQGLGLEV